MISSNFSLLDWLLLASYFVLLAVSGWWVNRQSAQSSSDYFIANRAIPTWVAAISVLATAQSAATFLGGPDMGFRGDFTYLSTNIGALFAALFVGYFLMPRFYQQNVSTVYELLEQRFGKQAKQAAGLMYLFGRVFANGARLYMAAIAVSMILFNDIAASHIVMAIVLLIVVSLLYSVWGGIKSVMYGDVVQCVIYVSAALLVVVYLYGQIPASFDQIVQALAQAPNGQNKLQLFDTRLDFTSGGAFTLASTLTGFFLLYLASFGLDQDMTQRALTCKNARQASLAVIWSVLLVVPVMAALLSLGMLLHIFYERPDLMQPDLIQQAGQGQIVTEFNGEKITVFMYYVLHEMPAGLRGFVTVGVIAAAVSTLTSGLNSMASVLIQDLYKPWQQQRQAKDEHFYVNAGRWSMIGSGTALSLMAVLCFYWQQWSDTPLLEFALGVMVFSYSGLLGVYAVVLFSKRGSSTSVIAALVLGFLVTLAQQPYIQTLYLPEQWQFQLAFTYQLVLGTAASFVCCWLGNTNTHTQHSKVTAESHFNELAQGRD